MKISTLYLYHGFAKSSICLKLISLIYVVNAERRKHPELRCERWNITSYNVYIIIYTHMLYICVMKKYDLPNCLIQEVDTGHTGCRRSPTKFWVWLYWKGCEPLTIHWCDPTADPHGDSWLLGFPPGPVRPSLGNLIPFSSMKEAMLTRVLVRTPDRHEPVADRNPFLKPSHRARFQQEQEGLEI